MKRVELKQLIKEVLKKTLHENTSDEAWELVGQKDPNIVKVIKDSGLKFDQESVDKLIPIIDKLPTTLINPSQIIKLKNFNNKPGEESLIKDILSISKSENPRQGYVDLMTKRDSNDTDSSGVGRQREYDIGSLYDQVVKGNYEPPVLINISDVLYVIGGRTRLYAGLASNKNIKAKILNIKDLSNK
jgi:hypothetical protein